MELNETIKHLESRLEKLNEYEAAANFKGGYQPCIDEYQNILNHLNNYDDLLTHIRENDIQIF